MNDEKTKQILKEARRVAEIRAALKEHVTYLKEAADRIEGYLAGEATADYVRLMFEPSPAGDGSGCDNHYIPVPLPGWKCPDAIKVIDYLERFPERLVDILWEDHQEDEE